MSAIEPGDDLVVTYGNGRHLVCRALDLRTKGKIAKLMKQCAAGSADAFDLLTQAVELCCPTITEEQWSTINEASAGEIINGTLTGASLTVDEEKKSESPHL